MIEIVLSSFNQLFNAINIFLQQKDLTLGAILAGVSPFIVLWIKISNEKGKKAKQMLIERRQMQIAFNVNEIMEKLGVDTKWNLQEIGSTNTVPQMRKRLLSYLRKVIIPKRRVFKVSKWTSRKFLMAILAAILPIINEQFNMGLDTNVIIAAIGGLVAFILGESHIDAKRAEAGDVNLTADNTSNK